MAKNLVTKILEDHTVEGALDPGEEVGLRIDQTLLQDATGTMACLQFERMGVQRVQVDLAVQYVDHNIIQLDFKNPDDHRFLQAFAAKYGMYYSRPGNGICHYLHVERFARRADNGRCHSQGASNTCRTWRRRPAKSGGRRGS